jgi:hypothetical protein
MTTKPYTLVTGATGKQGGAVARHLLTLGFPVKALTRNPDSAPARALRQRGAIIVQGDLEKKETLLAALQHCHALFSVQNYWEKGVGYEGEIRQARNLLQAAQEASIQHVVQASIADCDHAPGIKHFESKAVIEQMVRETGLAYTFLRTVRYEGKTIHLASDIVTQPELRKAYETYLPHKAPDYKIMTWLGDLINPEFSRQLQWNKKQGWTFSLDETRAVFPHLTSLQEFFSRTRERTPAAVEALI